jgi:hypothetical protein
MVQMVTLLTCIREVTGSNVSWESGYPTKGCYGLPDDLQKNAGIVHQIRQHLLHSRSLSIHYSVISLPFIALQPVLQATFSIKCYKKNEINIHDA